jgi:hypothetical protein
MTINEKQNPFFSDFINTEWTHKTRLHVDPKIDAVPSDALIV